MSGDRPRIVVFGDFERALRRAADWRAIDAAADVEIHHDPVAGEALRAALARADVLVLVRDRTPLTADLIAAAGKLRYVVFTGTRNTTLDLAALAARGIVVSHTEWGPSKDSTCELTWALILAAVKQLERQMAVMRQGGWRGDDAGPLPDVLAGQRLGLIGLGEIGKRVARVGQAFGMEVVTWSPRMTTERAAEAGVLSVSLEELLSTSRVVSLHLVPTDTTRHLINEQRLALMRRDALLVNTSRAALIDMPALQKALERGCPAMAALDVYDTEPVAAGDPLRQLSSIVATPHIGFVCEPVFARFAHGITECLESWLAGKEIVRRITA